MSSQIQRTSVLQSALERIRETPEFKRLVEEVQSGTRVVSISGLVTGSARALALASLQQATGKLFAIVAQANHDLEPLENDLRFWYCALHGSVDCENEVLLLPASESDPYAGSSPHAETLEKRALTLWRLTQQPQDFVLLTARALARKTVRPDELAELGTILKRDEDQAPEVLVEKLVASGYVREDPVSGVGEFSLRGGILDVWSPGAASPVRLEFFGDTVESIREFDPETQLSTTQLKQIEIAPMRELAVTADDFRAWSDAACERWAEPRFARSLRDRTSFAEEGEAFNGWE